MLSMRVPVGLIAAAVMLVMFASIEFGRALPHLSDDLAAEDRHCQALARVMRDVAQARDSGVPRQQLTDEVDKAAQTNNGDASWLFAMIPDVYESADPPDQVENAALRACRDEAGR